MTLGELKIACYKIINPTDEEMTVDGIPSYENNTNYSYYFLNMLPSINSAISRIVQETVLPIKLVKILASDYYTSSNYSVQINLKDTINDIYKIKHIEYQDGNGNRKKINARLLGNYLDIASKNEGYYCIYYYPRIHLLETYTNLFDTTIINGINHLELRDLGISDNLASIIPLYVKGDLLEHDKPSEAIVAKNTFDQYLQAFEQDEFDNTNINSEGANGSDGEFGVSCWWRDWL